MMIHVITLCVFRFAPACFGASSGEQNLSHTGKSGAAGYYENDQRRRFDSLSQNRWSAALG
jgi:hypothetical protein